MAHHILSPGRLGETNSDLWCRIDRRTGSQQGSDTRADSESGGTTGAAPGFRTKEFVMRSRTKQPHRVKGNSNAEFNPLVLDSEDPRRTATIAILYAELSRAQVDGNKRAIEYARDA